MDIPFYEEDPLRKDTREGSVFVIGPESSGTTWISEIVQHHPDVHSVHHFSYPAGGATPNSIIRDGGQGEQGRFWPDLWEYDSLGLSSVIIICRDITVTSLAQDRAGYGGNVMCMYMEDSIIEEAKKYIKDQLEMWKGKFAVMSYETMIQWPSLQLSQTFRLLDYDHNKFDYDILNDSGRHFFPTDGNEKYIRRNQNELRNQDR